MMNTDIEKKDPEVTEEDTILAEHLKKFKTEDDEIVVYLAAPFFDPEQIKRVEHVKEVMESIPKVRVFSPMHDGIVCSKDADLYMRQRAFKINVGGIELCDILVAIVDVKDTGTTYEMGVAFKGGVLVVAYAMEEQTKMNLMLSEGLHCFVHDDDELLKRFLTTYLRILQDLAEGMKEYRRRDLALAAQIKKRSALLQEEQQEFKKEHTAFDEDIAQRIRAMQNFESSLYQGEIE